MSYLVYLARMVLVLSGAALMVIGLAMGVSLVMLPVGVVVGLIGLAMFIAGQVNWNRQR